MRLDSDVIGLSYHVQFELSILLKEPGDFLERGVRLRLHIGFPGIEIDAVDRSVAGAIDVAGEARSIHHDQPRLIGFISITSKRTRASTFELSCSTWTRTYTSPSERESLAVS